MANPRELAEQAFTLLQNALRESEARAADLDAELKRKKAPKNKLEEQLDVLTHRIESVEAESARWQREASHLEEIIEAERAKVTQLRKKLEIAESGPDKLTKKEINFWRAKAEDIDTETKDYKTRLAALRKELLDRDAAIEKLNGSSSDEPREQREESHSDAAGANELQIEIETLRRQITSFEGALTDAHTRRAALTKEVQEAQAQLAEQQRNVREAQATSERTRATVNEREHRLVELSAELEHTRAEVVQNQDRERQLREAARELGEQNAALSRDLEAARSQGTASHGLKAAIVQRDQHLAERDRDLHERNQQLIARDQQISSLKAELEQARTAVQAGSRDLASQRDTLLTSNRELEQLRTHKHRLEMELSDVLTRVDHAKIEFSKQHEEIRRLTAQQAGLESQNKEIREQIAGLEAELKEEKDNTDNLSELANERREQITKLNEQVEEANERYEEAKWRLGRAQHFERLVKRRKGLINALLAALRAKSKSSTALKAGLDGLRTHKAAAEVNQQKLLARIDSLKADLEEAEETIARQQGATVTKEQVANTESRAAQLEARLNTQAELIQSLEADLKIAKVMHKSGDEKNAEIQRLHAELEAKNRELETKTQVLGQLQADADEQQRRLAKLRGSESETMRLKAVSEKDRGVIDALEREMAQLRDSLMRQSAQNNGAGAPHTTSELEAKLKERESSVARLMGTVKEHETTIKKLSESVESWKRKYQFLATDSPDAYKTAAEK